MSTVSSEVKKVVENAMKRATALGASVLTDYEEIQKKLETKANIDLSAVSLKADDVLTIPSQENFASQFFIGKIKNNPTAEVPTIITDEGKNLCLSTLVKSIHPTDDKGKLIADDEAVHSDTKLYNDLQKCATQSDIVDVIMGKKLKVVKVVSVFGPRFGKDANGNTAIVGNRKTSVPFIDYAE